MSFLGEGEYNLNNLKEIMITDSYLGLEQHIRGCQNQEPVFNCTTRNYIEAVIKNCGCLPLIIKLMSHMKVKLIYPM